MDDKHSILNSSLKAGQNLNISTTVNNYGDKVTTETDPLELLHQRVAFGALHDSEDRFDPPKCHPDTRTAVLSSVDAWGRNTQPGCPPIIWLNGAAGAGKSAIVQTSVEKWASDKELIVLSFFFWRTNAERNNKLRLVPTLAFQLLKRLPIAKAQFEEAIGCGDLFRRKLKSQVESLIIDPLKDYLAKRSGTVIAVIDGLDECCIDLPKTDNFPGQGHEAQQAEILDAMALACQKLPYLRVLIASRPERRIRLSFESTFFARGFLKAHTLPFTLNNLIDAKHDISLFLRCKFMEIRDEHRGLPKSWPSDKQIAQLVENSSGCFIYPSMATRFILRRRKDPMESLTLILRLRVPENKEDNPFAELDALYEYILRSVSIDSIGIVMDVFRYLSSCYYSRTPPPIRSSTLSCLLHSDHSDFNPLLFTNLPNDRKVKYTYGLFDRPPPFEETPQFFQDLYFLSPGQIFYHLTDLHAILDIPTPDDPKQRQEITFLHATFSQYLQDKQRSGDFYIGNWEDLQLHRFRVNERHLIKYLDCISGINAIQHSPVAIEHHYNPEFLLTNWMRSHQISRHEPTMEGLISLWIMVGPIVKWRPSCCGMRRLCLNPWNFTTALSVIGDVLTFLEENLDRMKLPSGEKELALQYLEAGKAQLQTWRLDNRRK